MNINSIKVKQFDELDFGDIFLYSSNQNNTNLYIKTRVIRQSDDNVEHFDQYYVHLSGNEKFTFNRYQGERMFVASLGKYNIESAVNSIIPGNAPNRQGGEIYFHNEEKYLFIRNHGTQIGFVNLKTGEMKSTLACDDSYYTNKWKLVVSSITSEVQSTGTEIVINHCLTTAAQP